MVTRYRVGSNRPPERLTLHVSSISPLPKSYRDVFNDPNWKNAMCDEYHALIKNNTWTLVPRPMDTNVVRCMWLFLHKFHADGTLSKYKARLVVNGSTQIEGVDVDETFSPVVKPGTIRTVLSLAASRHWHVHQLEVQNVFLHGDLSETVLCISLRDFGTLLILTMFVYFSGHFMGSSKPHGPGFRDLLHISPMLGFTIVVVIHPCSFIGRGLILLIGYYMLMILFLLPLLRLYYNGMFLSQKKYAIEILERVGIVNCNLCRTPVDTKSKLGDTGDIVSDPTLYRSLAGSLQYLTFTRPDISYAVQQLFSSSTTDLVAYSNADWAGFPTTRRLTSGYCVFLGNNLLSWSSKRQPTLSRSSAEAEYRGVANAVTETCWICCHQRTKHIEIDIHFVRDLVAAGQVRVLHVPSRYQFADIFTKGLPSALFEEFRSSLSVWCPPAPTAGEC
ncbi:ribonuclease H-like domain-containing protein [Tanacetum coccineum]